MSGWFAVTRDSLSHPLFKREPVSEWEAWTRLVARAAHADTRHRVGGELLDVERGSFFCTLRELQSEFMWRSDARVRKFLERLENERMIERKTNAGKTHVTICNYDEYQGGERKNNAKRTQPGTQDERKTNALKNKRTIKQGGKPPLPPADGFEDFWAVYPHRGGARKGKAQARKKYAAAVNAGASSEEINAAAARFQNDRQAKRGFSPDPSTWLNQRRWEDEIETEGGRNASDDTTTDRLRGIISAAAARPSREDWPDGGGDNGGGVAAGHTGRGAGAGDGELDGPPAKPLHERNQSRLAVLPVGHAEPHGDWRTAQTGPGAAVSDCAGEAPEAGACITQRYAWGG